MSRVGPPVLSVTLPRSPSPARTGEPPVGQACYAQHSCALCSLRTLYVSRKTAKGSIFPYPCAHFLGTCHLLPRRKCCRPHEKEGIGGVKGRRGRGGRGEGIFLVRPLSSLAKAADLYRGAFGNVSGTFCLFPLPPLHRRWPHPAAGKPLYEAQKSDFLRRKDTGLRKFWRIWRNCAKICADSAHASTHAQKLRKICATVFI